MVRAGNNFTYDDWVAHRSTQRYARHIAGLLGWVACRLTPCPYAVQRACKDPTVAA